MAGRITEQITVEEKSAKLYSIIVDLAPDISHVNELSFILIYIKEDGHPVERFFISSQRRPQI
jgi:hypothetical protein